jgi:RNA polymerase sigma factor (sigma-70 family)
MPNQSLDAQFEQQRPRLRAVAYRMLGSVSEAEDAVQEAWVRLHGSPDDAIDNLAAWLTTVVGRVCIDMLRARQTRAELTGGWLPEPIVSTSEQLDPEQEALLADSVGLALLVVLETLSPPERLAFVLHDMFGMPFDEIAPIVERSPEAARQPPVALGGASGAPRRAQTEISPGSARSWPLSWPRRGAATSTGCWRCSTPRSCSAPMPAS